MDLNRIIRNQNRQIGRRIPGGVTAAIAAFKSPSVTTRAAAAATPVSLLKARDALAAAHKALAELARRATDIDRRNYKDLMDRVLGELKAVAQKILDDESKQYVPLTAALKEKTKALVSAYEKAKKTISDLNNASEILTGFGTLISAIA